MLIQVVLYAETNALVARLESLLDSLDVSVRSEVAESRSAEDVDPSADIVLASGSSLAGPLPQTVSSIRASAKEREVIIVWEGENPQERAQLLSAGCLAVLNLAVTDDVLRDALEELIERRRQAGTARQQRETLEPQPKLEDFESTNSRMNAFLRVVRRVVEPNSSLLILGETGVGKERLARAIHAVSPRADKPFVPVILSAFPETLLDAELFGHEKSAFTGADYTRRGCFEMAHGGTIFLDEIGELPVHLQVKLLRVIQERTIQRIGSERFTEVNVRIMAASNRDLKRDARSGKFRNDLYYRLSVVELEVPPLRQHPEDIPRLVHRYLEEFRVKLRCGVRGVSDSAMGALCRYRWPGNIRELINILERAILLCEGPELTLSSLPFDVAHTVLADRGAMSTSGVDVHLTDDWLDRPWRLVRHATVAKAEVSYLKEHLGKARGNLTEVAKRTGLNPRTLYDMMQRHGLSKDSYRESD